MNYRCLFKNEGLSQIRVALVGVGDFGATLLDQARNIEKINITVICDKDEQRMRDAVRDSGMASQPMMVTDITADGLPRFDVLVEATGQPEDFVATFTGDVASLDAGHEVGRVGSGLVERSRLSSCAQA